MEARKKMSRQTEDGKVCVRDDEEARLEGRKWKASQGEESIRKERGKQSGPGGISPGWVECNVNHRGPPARPADGRTVPGLGVTCSNGR